MTIKRIQITYAIETFPYFHPGFHLEEETFTGCSNTNVYPFHFYKTFLQLLLFLLT